MCATDRAPTSTTFSEGDMKPTRGTRKLLARRRATTGSVGTSVIEGTAAAAFRQNRSSRPEDSTRACHQLIQFCRPKKRYGAYQNSNKKLSAHT